MWVHNVLTNAAGNYSVIVSNSGGVTQSAAAVLSVTDTNPVPVVTALPPTNSSRVPFILTGEPGRWYKFEVKNDLLDPFALYAQYGQATNTANSFSVPRFDQQKQFLK